MKLHRQERNRFLLMLILCSEALACASGPKVEKTVASSLRIPIETQADGGFTLPPSEDWMPQVLTLEESMPSTGIKLFAWNWSFFEANGEVKVLGANRRRTQQKMPLPFEPTFQQMVRLAAVLPLEIADPWGLCARYLIGYRGFEGERGGLWWSNKDGKRFGPIIGGSVRALYQTPAGVIALQEKTFLSHEGKPYAKRGYRKTGEISAVLLRNLGSCAVPDVEGVVRMPGDIIRHFVQSDDSIAIETRDSLLLLLPSGRRLLKISDKEGLTGSLRSIQYSADEAGVSLVLTSTGLWRVKSLGGGIEPVCRVDTSYTYPSQVYVPLHEAKNGDVYLGLTYFLVRLARTGDDYKVEWYVPSYCLTARVDPETGDCFCFHKKGKQSPSRPNEVQMGKCSRIGG